MQTDIEIPEWLAQKVAFEGRYAAIPPTTQYTLRMWVLYAQTPGGFVEAVLRNDLHGAFNNADDENSEALPLIMMWIHNECPQDAWLSPGNHPEACDEAAPGYLEESLRKTRRDVLVEHIQGFNPMKEEEVIGLIDALAGCHPKDDRLASARTADAKMAGSSRTKSYRDAGREQLYKFKGYCRG